MSNHGIEFEQRHNHTLHSIRIGADHRDGPEARATFHNFDGHGNLNVHAAEGVAVDAGHLDTYDTYTIGTDLWCTMFFNREQAEAIYEMLGKALEDNA